MGCFDSKTSFELPSFIKRPSKAISGGVMKALNTPFEAYTAPRVADMTGSQTDVMAKLREILGLGGTGGSMTLPRLIDDIPGAPGTPGGSTQDYMDPFLDQVLAPALRNINLGTDYGLHKNDAMAHMAGAFGDSGHGIERSKTINDGAVAAGDATGRLYSAAYDDAMTRKGADIDRMRGQQDDTVQRLLSLFNMGGVEQGTKQAKLDADFEEFLRRTGFDLDKLAKAAGVIGSLSPGQMTKSPSTASSIVGGLSSIASLFA